MRIGARVAVPLVALSMLSGCGGSKQHAEPGLRTGFHPPKAYSLQALERESYRCGRENESCAISYLTKLTSRYGPHASLGVLGALEQSGKIDPAFDTHQLAHIVGEATAKRFGANKRAFGLCPNSFNYGCVHGFFIYVLGKSPTPQKAAATICNSRVRGPLVPTFNCWHGVGHGVMMARGNDLAASLDVCDTLGSATAADACWQGVFMENVNAEMRNQARPGVFSRADPLRPCTRVAAAYRHECFINQAGWLAFLARDDVAKASRYCLRAPGPYVSVCAQSIGLMITNPSWQASFAGGSRGGVERTAWRLCLRFPARLRKNCVIGGVDNLANFDQLDVSRSARFCGSTTPALQSACYREIGVNLARRTDAATARSRCAATGSRRRDCLAGVRQGSLPAAPLTVPRARATRPAVLAPGKPAATVRMTDSGYVPRVLTIRQGQTVRFSDEGARDYWPASDPHPIHTDYPGFDAEKVIHPSGSWSFRFDRLGRWGYHNHLAPETTGTIVVLRKAS